MRASLWSALSAGAIASLIALSAAADTIRIGLISEITGPNAEAGSYTINGAKLAAEAINKKGGVLGKQIELVIEDNQSTNPGTVLAFSKLGGNTDMPAIIGPIRSTQVQAASPTIQKAGLPVMIGGTDPSLTHVNNPWVFRCRPNDTYSSRVIADFGVNTLKLKKWAIVHSTDAFGTAGGKALSDALGKLGAPPVLDQGYANQSQDFTPVVLAVKQSGADVLGTYFTFENDLGIFARQLRQLGVNIPWVGSPSVVAVSSTKLAGPALFGTYGVADYAEESGDAPRAFGKAYREAYKTAPDIQSSWTFDAVTILSAAINKAGSTDPAKIRDAILSLKKFPGAEGEYNFDQNGDGLHGYNVVRNEKGTIVFDKHIEFNE